MRVGIDVGGTNTDAVLMDRAELAGRVKAPTSADVTGGITAALEELLAQAPAEVSIEAVMLGTTHFTNALLERKDLSPTATLRLALPANRLLPPFVDWPEPLRDAAGGLAYMVPGGHEYDGREISPADISEVRSAVRDMVRKGVEAVAVSGVFSAVNPAHEDAAAEVIRQEAPHLHVTLSRHIGRIGILERENAAALNACLAGTAVRTISGIREALRSLGLDAPLYLSQNDGTLMDADYAARFPVFTIASGPTNSMRGATYLSGVEDGIVVDVGGTSTDVGALVRGFPREASVAVSMAGVRTNFRMPDVFSVALGGGSVVGAEPLSIGPRSVGYRLSREARVFGGATLTATDAAVASGRARVGDPALVSGLDARLVSDAVDLIQEMVEDAVDQVKLSADPAPVVLVGGGSILVGEPVKGASRVLRPEHFDVANAIGAAIAQVGGQVERVLALEGVDRDEALAAAREEAVSKAVGAGADPATVQIVEMEEVPLAYLPGNATLVRARAVGDLAHGVYNREAR